jgi:hypothetical protein
LVQTKIATVFLSDFLALPEHVVVDQRADHPLFDETFQDGIYLGVLLFFEARLGFDCGEPIGMVVIHSESVEVVFGVDFGLPRGVEHVYYNSKILIKRQQWTEAQNGRSPCMK